MGDASPPAITLSAPVQMRPDRYAVQIHVSSEPHLIHRRFGHTAKEALSRAREFKEARLALFYKSLAAKHRRTERRIAQARNDAGRANTGA